MGAKSKWQVNLQDTFDTRYDLHFKSQFLTRNSGSEKTINYFTFFDCAKMSIGFTQFGIIKINILTLPTVKFYGTNEKYFKRCSF